MHLLFRHFQLISDKGSVWEFYLLIWGAGCCLFSFSKEVRTYRLTASYLSSSAAAATGGSVINVAALLASGTQVTPQIAMAAQMAALQAKALAETGIAVPSYYNPAAVNPMKFAEQEKKRKMLWQGKKEGVMLSFLTFIKLLWKHFVLTQFKDPY